MPCRDGTAAPDWSMAEQWNLSQTWAWIRWRDPVKVNAFAHEAHLGLAEAMLYPDGSRIVEEGHRPALLQALRAGRITADGLTVGSDARSTIPQEVWTTIEPVAPSEARHAVPGNRRVAWRALRFPAADVMRLWPGNSAPPASRAGGLSIKA